jgi:hypothetical protein
MAVTADHLDDLSGHCVSNLASGSVKQPDVLETLKT